MAIASLAIPCAVMAQCIKSGNNADHCDLRNNAVSASWSQSSGRIESLTIEDRRIHQQLKLDTPFKVLLADGSVYAASDFTLQAPPHMRALTANPAASRMSDRLNGDAIDTQLTTPDGRLKVLWSVILRDGSEYVREEVTLTAAKDDVAIRRVEMIDSTLPTAAVSGSVKGSPIVAGTFFLGMEHPLSDSKVTAGHATAYLDRKLPLRAGQSVTYSAVIGTTQAGQLRRDFLTYVERERAHPYRTFLHYNTWYDLGFFNTYDEAGALDRINAFGRELHDKRGVTLDSFLFDDGWDDHASLWKFHSGFPQGFTNVKNAAAKYGTAPGVWMSPWGGYGNPKKERVEAGREQGFEIVNNGFALSGPKYFERFEQVCMDMVRNYGVNQFKFDGTGNANSVFKGSAYDSDFDAAIHLIGDLRHQRPDLFVNLTTGTYPSPFWLMVADSIWRGGEDDDVAGVGPYRERWITYRDADTYDEVVKNGPLFPLNSLMLHGLIYASRHKQLNTDPTGAFRHEIRSYFGTGTQTQEMYITPSLLSQANWDDLAEAAKWSRANASVLKDTHWVGGDPAWLQVYGWAAWSPGKSILTLRNPSDKPQIIALDMAAVLELPTAAAHTFTARSPWQSDAAQVAIRLEAGKQHLFQLAPFEVLTLELQPR
jgi:hypothetical protein